MIGVSVDGVRLICGGGVGNGFGGGVIECDSIGCGDWSEGGEGCGGECG